MEVEPKESGGKVNVARIFMDLVKALETAADADVKFYDVNGKTFSASKAPSTTSFTTDFLVTPTEGKVRKGPQSHPRILFGKGSSVLHH